MGIAHPASVQTSNARLLPYRITNKAYTQYVPDFLFLPRGEHGQLLNLEFKKMTFSYLHYESAGKTIRKLAVQLCQIDPDVHYEDWMRPLMVIFYETGGSEEGFELADAWSSGGGKYLGTKDVRSTWRYIRPDHPKPVRIGTLIRMARQG